MLRELRCSDLLQDCLRPHSREHERLREKHGPLSARGLGLCMVSGGATSAGFFVALMDSVLVTDATAAGASVVGTGCEVAVEVAV